MSEPTTEEVIAELLAKRGYVLDFHRQLAATDPGFLRHYEAFLEAAYTGQRQLPRRDKELIYIGVLVGLGADASHIGTHLRIAHEQGMSKEELLEVIEMCIPSAGVPKFMKAFEGWWELFGEAASAPEA